MVSCLKFGRILTSKRSIHVMPTLPFEKDIEIGRFMSPKTVNLLLEIQQSNLNKINQISTGNSFSNLTLYQIMEKTYNDANQARMYALASQAWNTDFFLQGLTPESIQMSDKLVAVLEKSFGSVAKFMNHLSNTALALNGSGFVWLVKTSHESDGLKIVCTFNSCSPMFQSVIPLTVGASSTFSNNTKTGSSSSSLFSAFSNFAPPIPSSIASPPIVSNKLSALRQDTSEASRPVDSRVPGEAKVFPVLGLSMWEHAYIFDYGIDKEAYLKRFWDAINWNRMAILMNLY